MSNDKEVKYLKFKNRKSLAFDESDEFLSRFKESFIKSINGLFIFADREKDLVIFYGNNKGIMGLDDDFIVMSFKECMEYIHPDFIDILINGIKCNLEEIEIKIINLNGQEVWISIKGQGENSEKGSLQRFEGYVHNITKEKDASLKLEYMSYYDELTGLINRKKFKENT